jgi:hypothetical protein
VTAPASRLADYVNSLLAVAPSTMKNPATGCDRVLRFDLQDWRKIPMSHALKKRLLSFLKDLTKEEVREEQAEFVAKVIEELELEEADS